MIFKTNKLNPVLHDVMPAYIYYVKTDVVNDTVMKYLQSINDHKYVVQIKVLFAMTMYCMPSINMYTCNIWVNITYLAIVLILWKYKVESYDFSGFCSLSLKPCVHN